MDKATAAEWLLCRVVGPARAEEIIGDQLEADPHAQPFRFWAIIIWNVLVFSWRTALGMVCGAYVGVWSWFPVAFAWQRLAHNQPSQAMIDFMLLSMPLWCMSAFSLVRFGVWSDMFWLSVLTAFLGTAGATLLQLPGSWLLLLVSSAVLLGSHLLSRNKRDALSVFAICIAAAWVTGSCALALQRAVHSFSKWPLLLAIVLIPLIEGLLSSHLYETLHTFRSHRTRGVAS